MVIREIYIGLALSFLLAIMLIGMDYIRQNDIILWNNIAQAIFSVIFIRICMLLEQKFKQRRSE
ncbi:hypothetical protein [Virgibacillus salexigens]|uniref:hypothetical protein n=1 Tax=Virgibacillus salexigens TaxID=61016 RepID=UPI003081762B